VVIGLVGLDELVPFTSSFFGPLWSTHRYTGLIAMIVMACTDKIIYAADMKLPVG